MANQNNALQLCPTLEISISTEPTISPLRIVLQSSFRFTSSLHLFQIAFPLYISEENRHIFLSVILLFLRMSIIIPIPLSNSNLSICVYINLPKPYNCKSQWSTKALQRDLNSVTELILQQRKQHLLPSGKTSQILKINQAADS